jgi:hypothetical protein
VNEAVEPAVGLLNLILRTRIYYWPANLLALLGAGTLIHWWRIARPMWVDEEMIALNFRDRSLLDLAGPLWLDQSSPLGWLVLERLALFTFGSSERALRALPVLFGIGTLGVALWIGRRWMTPLGAAILVALCAVGPWLVFFTLELKHYSADACWALLLPALAAWAIEPNSTERLTRRVTMWWIAAAVGSWLSNGATFVAPACAAVLLGKSWQQGGWRAAARSALPGAGWLISFGVLYWLALRHALGNSYLQTYWSAAFPPLSSGFVGTLGWLLKWLASFAAKPVGTAHWVLFWIATISGFAFAIARGRAPGLPLALVPVSMLALGILRVVPPAERLAVWAVPALYAGVALCGDASFWLARRSQSRWRLAGLACSACAASIAVVMAIDIVRNGKIELEAKPLSNYRLDDRRSIRFLQTMRRPGDAVLTTHFGLAGLWWYGPVKISGPDGGSHLDGSRIFEVSHVALEADCDQWKREVDTLFKDIRGVVVYLGFRMNVEPPGFDKLVLDELGRRGALVGYRGYAEASHVAAYDFTRPPSGAFTLPFVEPESGAIPPLSGCVAIRPARRW